MDELKKLKVNIVEGYPKYSPDFNIIEELFSVADFDKLLEDHEKGRASTKEKAVQRFAKHAKTRKSMMTKAAESMPARLEGCIASNGGPTQY